MDNPFGKKNIRGILMKDTENHRFFRMSYTRARYRREFLYGETAKYGIKECERFDVDIRPHTPEKGAVMNAFWECMFWRPFLGIGMNRIYDPDVVYLQEYEEDDKANALYDYFRDISKGILDRI